jgi:hypothetical protein
MAPSAKSRRQNTRNGVFGSDRHASRLATAVDRPHVTADDGSLLAHGSGTHLPKECRDPRRLGSHCWTQWDRHCMPRTCRDTFATRCGSACYEDSDGARTKTRFRFEACRSIQLSYGRTASVRRADCAGPRDGTTVPGPRTSARRSRSRRERQVDRHEHDRAVDLREPVRCLLRHHHPVAFYEPAR